MAIALIAIMGVSTAAAIVPVPVTRHVAPGGVDSGDCAAAPCETIQYAVDQALAGDTVDVAAGTYDEPQVIVSKPLTMTGAGAGQTIVDGSSASGLTSTGLLKFKSPAVGDISVSGFTFEGSNAGNTAEEALLIGFSQVPAGSQVTVSDNQLLASEDLDPDIATDWSLGVYVSASGAAFAIEDNRFEGMWQGILVEHSTGATTIAGNEFVDLVSTTSAPNTFAGEGILLLADGKSGGGGDAVTSPQVVRGNSFHGYAGLGVAVQSGHSSITPITPNSFSDVTVAENEIALEGAMFPTTGRPLAGVILKTGQAQSTIEGADILRNTISVSAPGNDVAVEGAVSATEVHVNRLAGGPVAGLDASLAAAAVSATDNWWGCNAGPGAPGCVAATGQVGSFPNLIFTGSASPSQVAPGGTSSLAAGLLTDSDGNHVAGVPEGGEQVSFASALGALVPGSASLIDGLASSTFTAGTQPGDAGVSASLDGEQIVVPLTVLGPPPAGDAAQPQPQPQPAPVPPTVKPAATGSPKPVPDNGQVKVAVVGCPAGTCQIATKAPKAKIGGKSYPVRVKAPAKLAAGGSAAVKVILPRAAREALAQKGRGKVTLRITVTSSTGATETVTVTVKLVARKHS